MRRSRIVQCIAMGALSLVAAACARAGDDFPPVNPAELAMQQEPWNTRPAEILYHESNLNDREHYQTEYYRIKIFSEAGRKYGDVEIPFDRDVYTISAVKARTVLRDGTVVPFDGKVFDKVLAKGKGLNLRAAAFNLPQVQPGCILEYRYKLSWGAEYWVMPRWIVQEELPVVRSHFSISLPPGIFLAPVSILPEDFDYSRPDAASLELTVSHIAPFTHEDYSLPDEALKWRVLFYALPSKTMTADEFWKEVGKSSFQKEEDFTRPRRGVTDEVAGLLQPSDTPEAKLRKLYARAQQIHDLTYDRLKTQAEEKRQKLKGGDNAERVLLHGYGYFNQINRTFVALARAAGFEASMVYVSEAYEIPFNPKVLDLDQVPWGLAMVKMGNEERYFDPATPGCPFGLLPPEDIRVKGVRPVKDGMQFVSTPLTDPDASQRLRKADFAVREDGSLHGHLSLTYTGVEALQERLAVSNEDEAGRLKHIEDAIRAWLPSSAQVKVESVKGWEESEQPLQAEATLDIPNDSGSTGRHILLPSDIFEVNRKNPFSSDFRLWDILFQYPFVTSDELTLRLPAGWQVEALPASQEFGGGVRLHYLVSRVREGAEVKIRRQQRLNDVFFESVFYPALRQFYSLMQASDEEPLILSAGGAAGQPASPATRKP